MSRLAKFTQTAGFNAGAEAYAKWMNPREIKINPDIAKLFENDRSVIEKIKGSMEAYGFDKSEPLVIWKGTGCVVDGHTRLKAALEAEIEEVLVEEKEFEDVNAAKMYTLTRQLNRRNLTAAALLEIASLLDTMKEGGKNRGEAAKGLGVSRTTLYRAQEVSKKAPEPVKEQVRQGQISINQAYNKITEKPLPPPPSPPPSPPSPPPPSPSPSPPPSPPRRRKEADNYPGSYEEEAEEEIVEEREKAARPVSPLLNKEAEKGRDMPLSIKALFEEISRLLKEFLAANGEKSEGLEKVRAAYTLAQKLIERRRGGL